MECHCEHKTFHFRSSNSQTTLLSKKYQARFVFPYAWQGAALVCWQVDRRRDLSPYQALRNRLEMVLVAQPRLIFLLVYFDAQWHAGHIVAFWPIPKLSKQASGTRYEHVLIEWFNDQLNKLSLGNRAWLTDRMCSNISLCQCTHNVIQMYSSVKCILNIGTRWRRVASFTRRPFAPRERALGANCVDGCVSAWPYGWEKNLWRCPESNSRFLDRKLCSLFSTLTAKSRPQQRKIIWTATWAI